jgi:phage-related minor tail protein
MVQAFRLVGEEIESSLTQAARTGELNFEKMVGTMLSQLARLAIDQLIPQGETELSQFFSNGLNAIIGQRAEGGPVLAGERYLVGERGPEVFVPPSGGHVSPLASAPSVNVIINTGPDASEGVRRSERQIAAAIARAVRAGGQTL